MTDDQFEEFYRNLVERMLEEGVPPGVVGRVLLADDELVKETQKKVRIRKYGTDDLNDYLEQVQWDTLEWAKTTLASGAPAAQARVAATVLGKQMTVAAKRTPQGERDTAEQILQMFADMRK